MAAEDPEILRLYDRALSVWGREAQIRMAQEECAELIVAINKWSRSASAEHNVIEEVADVEIMCGQMRIILGDKSIDDAKARKLERLEERLAKRKQQTQNRRKPKARRL